MPPSTVAWKAAQGADVTGFVALLRRFAIRPSFVVISVDPATNGTPLIDILERAIRGRERSSLLRERRRAARR